MLKVDFALSLFFWDIVLSSETVSIPVGLNTVNRPLIWVLSKVLLILISCLSASTAKTLPKFIKFDFNSSWTSMTSPGLYSKLASPAWNVIVWFSFTLWNNRWAAALLAIPLEVIPTPWILVLNTPLLLISSSSSTVSIFGKKLSNLSLYVISTVLKISSLLLLE